MVLNYILIRLFCLSAITNETTLSSGIATINEPELQTDDAKKEHDSESDDSKSSSSTELCDEPDRLSDFDSEEPTSISDTSSQVFSTGEGCITKLTFPSTADKSCPPTPELQKPSKITILPSQSKEFVVFDSKPSLISQSRELTDNSNKRVEAESSLMQQPLFVLEECEIKPSEETKEVLLHEDKLDVSVPSPSFAADDSESSVNKESSEMTSETESSPAIDTMPYLKLLSSKEIPVYEKTHDIDKLSVFEDYSVAVSSRESSSDIEFDHSKQSSSEKSEPAMEIDASETLKQSSPTEEHSPVLSELIIPFQSSELIMEMTEKGSSDEIVLKEIVDSCHGSEALKSVERISEDSGMVEFDTHFTEHPVTQPSTSEVMQPEEKCEMAKSNTSTGLKSVKVTDCCMQKITSILEITQQNHQDTSKSLQSPITEAVQCETQDISSTALQCGNFSPRAPSRMLQDDICTTTQRAYTTRQNGAETSEELKSEIGTYKEKPILVIDRSCVAMKEFGIKEDMSVFVDDNEGDSKLLELNERLQDKEQVLRTRNQACEVGNVVDRGDNYPDYTEMSELLEIDQNINLGRRNSERALKIIQENSEILQRILQCQGRRPNKLSLEESNYGTTTIPSEADSSLPSIPTSTSPQNADAISCLQLQAESDVPKRNSHDSCILGFVSPKDGVSVELPNEVSISSSIPTCSFAESEVFPDHPQSDTEMYIKLQSLPSVKEENVSIRTTEHCDNQCFSLQDTPEEFLKTQKFLNPRQHGKQESPLRPARNFMLSIETSMKKCSTFSFAPEVLKPKLESDDVAQVSRSSEEQFQSESGDRTTSNISVHSSCPLSDDVYHVDSRVYRNTELGPDTERIQSGWKRFSEMDSNLNENISSKFPKCFPPAATNCSSHSSYASKDGKEHLQFMESPVKVVTETKTLTSLKQTYDNDGDFTTDKHFITAERTSNDFQPHIDTSFPELSEDSPSSSSWYFENSKLKDASSSIKSANGSHNLLSHPCSSSATFSVDLSISKPYASISRHEYSPTKSRSSVKESNTECFEHDSSKHKEVFSSWHTKDSVTCPTLKSSPDKTEISPIVNYLQNSSSSSNKGFTEDLQHSSHPSAISVSKFSGGSWDVTHRTTRKSHSRPHSTVITDVTPTEILNRSYSSSSIDAHLTRTSPELSSPLASPDEGKSPSFSKFVQDESSSLAPKKTESSIYNPIPQHERDSPVPVSASDQYRHSSESSRRNDSEPKFSIKDLSPMSHSSISQSRWEKDNISYSSSSSSPPIKSENRSEKSDSQTPLTESFLVNTSLSATKVYKPPTVSPTKSKDIHVSLPPIKVSSVGSPTKSKSKFDPFPPRPTMRQPKELGIKLGLYSTDCAHKNGKLGSKRT